MVETKLLRVKRVWSQETVGDGREIEDYCAAAGMRRNGKRRNEDGGA